MTSAAPIPPLRIPPYGDASIAELLTSVLAAVGAPYDSNRLALDPARRSCILLVDGLGWELLRAHRSSAPFLSALAERGRVLSAAFPTTTATCLASFGTGLPPGGHGMVGYQIAVPGQQRLLNALHWDESVVPEIWQPVETAFERAAKAGVTVTQVGPAVFRNGGLTRAALRGADYIVAETWPEQAARVVSRLGGDGPAVVYTYIGDVDRAGHGHGVGSAEWHLAVRHADELAQLIAEGLPPGAVLYVTADHGMVNVPATGRLDADQQPGLTEGVALLGGDARARHVYAIPGAASDLLAAWRDSLADRAWVLTRHEAIAAGLFGPVADWAAPRIGDIVVVCTGKYAVTATRREPVESGLIGMHGSLTSEELAIPLLEYRA